MVSRNLIDQAGKTLADVAGPDSTVILFGSHARGEASLHHTISLGLRFMALQDQERFRDPAPASSLSDGGAPLAPEDAGGIVVELAEQWR